MKIGCCSGSQESVGPLAQKPPDGAGDEKGFGVQAGFYLNPDTLNSGFSEENSGVRMRDPAKTFENWVVWQPSQAILNSDS